MPRRNRFQELDRCLAAERHNALQGSAKVKLSQVNIGAEWELNQKQLETLRQIFQKTGVYPLQRENHVEVTVSRGDLEHALERHGLTARSFREKEPNDYPELDFNGRQLRCLHGKHRIQAARDTLPPLKQWWIVDIYLDDMSDELRRTQAERFCHEVPKSAGEKYLNMRYYERIGDNFSKQRWQAQLSSCEKERIGMLEQRVDLWKAFDALLDIPAVILAGTLLTTWNKLLALHCDDELIHYLKCIRDFWTSIVQQNPDSMKKIDSESVNALEGLAPGVSSADRTRVRSLVLGGESFRNFSEEERNHIHERLKEHKGRIPSLSLFFQDALFFAIAARRVRDLLDVRAEETALKRQPDQTVQDRMEFMFHFKDDGYITIQTSENEDRRVCTDNQSQFDLAYRQVWLCALRSSSGRPGKGNRPAVLWAWTDPQAQYQLSLLASHLGFKSKRIEKTIRSPPNPAPYPWHDFEYNRVPSLKRCGIPYTITFREDRQSMFLDQVHTVPEVCGRLNSTFILRDIYLSFFGHLPLSALNDNPPSRGRHRRAPSLDTARTNPPPTNPPPTDAPPTDAPPTDAPSTDAPSTDAPPTDATTHAANGSSASGETGSPTLASSSQNTSNFTNTSTTNIGTTPRSQRGSSVASEDPPTQPSCTNETMEDPPLSTPRDSNSSLREEALISRVKEMKKQMQDLLDGLIAHQNKFIEALRTAADQEYTLRNLRQEFAAELTRQAVGQEGMELINTNVNEWRQKLERAKEGNMSDTSKVKEQLTKLDSLVEDGPGREIGRDLSSRSLSQTQAIYNYAEREHAKREELLRESQSHLPRLHTSIGNAQVFGLGLQLGALNNDTLSLSAKVDTLISTLPELGNALGPMSSEMTQAQEIQTQSLQDIKRDLEMLGKPLQEQLQLGTDVVIDSRPNDFREQDQLRIRQKAWISTSLALKNEAVESLHKAQTSVASIERRLKFEYANIILAQVESLETRLKAEASRLEQLGSGQQDQACGFSNFIKAVESNQAFLVEHLDEKSRARLNELTTQVKDGLKSAYITKEGFENAYEESRKEVEAHRLHLQEPVDLQRQLNISKRSKEISDDMDKRESEHIGLGELLIKRQNDIQDVYMAVAEALQQALSMFTSKAQEESSAALHQREIAEEAENQNAAKEAAETAQAAANNSNCFAELVLTVKHLVDMNDAPIQLRDGVKVSLTASVAAAEQATVAANAAMLSAHSWAAINAEVTTLIGKIRKSAATAENIERGYKSKKGTEIDFTRKTVKNMAGLATSILNNTQAVQSQLMPTTASVSLQRLVGAARAIVIEATAASTQTTELIFSFFHLVAERVAKAMEENEKQIVGISSLVQGAGDKQEWEARIRDAQKTLECCVELHELAEYTKTIATRQKSKVEQDQPERSLYQEATQSIQKINEFSDAAEKGLERVRSLVEKIQSAGQSEDRGKDPVGIGRNDIDTTTNSTNTNANEKEAQVRDARILTKEVARLDTRVTAIHTEYKVAQEGARARISKWCGMVDEVEHLTAESHRISQQMQSQMNFGAGGVQDILKEAMDTSQRTTNTAINIFLSLTQKMASGSHTSKKYLEIEATRAHEAAERESKEEWQDSVNRSQEIISAFDEGVSLAERAKHAAERTKSSFDKHGIKELLSYEATEAFENMGNLVQALKKNQSEAQSVFTEMEMCWWKEKSNQKHRSAHQEVEKAKLAFQHIAPADVGQKDYQAAEQAFLIAKETYEEANREWSDCRGPQYEFQRVVGRLEFACSAASAAIRAAKEVLEKQASRSKDDSQKRKGDSLGNTSNDLPKRRTSATSYRRKMKRVCVYKITNANWESEVHFIPPATSFKKGQELCGRGTLHGFNLEMTRLGTKTADGFAQSVASGQDVFFLQAHDLGPDITSSKLYFTAKMYYEIYRESHRVIRNSRK